MATSGTERTLSRINRFIQRLERLQWVHTLPIVNWTASNARYSGPSQYGFLSAERSVSEGDWLADSGQTVFLNKIIEMPEHFSANPVGFVFRVSGRGEGLLTIDDIPYHGLDSNHHYVPLQDSHTSKGPLKLAIELYNPKALPCDELNLTQVSAEETNPPPLYLTTCQLVVPNRQVMSLIHTVLLYQGVAQRLPVENPQRNTIVAALRDICDQVLSLTDAELASAKHTTILERALLEGVSALEIGPASGTMRMVGQSHIDVAWLWPVNETIRKSSRTFSTACTLLDTYSDFTYSQSQPLLYNYVKEHYPSLYERIKAKVAEGRWELVGGMWVEPDLNIPSGESLVRQLLYGQRFFSREFGMNPRIEWLPDTFGYCASLPQLLKKAGMEYFMTTKMNWNDTNTFPYDVFYWTGIDGTRILSYLNHGLNEHTKPRDVGEHWDSFRQKDEHPEQMLLYGHGDGGGGVTMEMVEYINRSSQLPGLPRVIHSKAHDFFDGIASAKPNLPEWVGDLYLELHRGTYTTHARTKRNNRKAEVLYRDAEIWSSFATLYGADYPASEMETGWKQILLNQFHDIVPGSAIHEVYERADSDYRVAMELGQTVMERALDEIGQRVDTQGDGEPYLLFNSLSWSRDSVLHWRGGSELLDVELQDATGSPLDTDVYRNYDGTYELVARVDGIPALGYTTVRKRHGQTRSASSGKRFAGNWETPLYVATWNNRGEMTRLYDKQTKREVIAADRVGNEFQLFHDLPEFWDAWDIDPRFDSQRADAARLETAEVVLQGRVQDVLRFRWHLGESEIIQDVVFCHVSRRIDFHTFVEWRETHKLLKVAFPVEIFSTRATYEIPFGSVERPTHNNTSWERAQFEVCGHRWADISESGYGVSLLNDCKYGYDVKGSVLRLSLLRSSRWPDPYADCGGHEFTYSLFPHQGDWRDGEVVKQGYELNHPIQCRAVSLHEGHLSHTGSLLGLEGNHVVVDTVKQAEDGEELIVRLYESAGGRQLVHLSFAFPVHAAWMANLLEEPESDLPLEQSTMTLQLRPFEVATVKVLAHASGHNSVEGVDGSQNKPEA